MKKLMKKKVNMFGKEFSVFAIVMVAMIGLATAALIPYFGLITGMVTVSQSVLLNGNDYNTPVIDTLSNVVAGTPIVYKEHDLTNANPSIDAIVSLDSSCTKDGTADDGSCAELMSAKEFELESIIGSANDDEDNLHLIPDTAQTWSTFSNVSFDYNITYGGNYIPHVNLVLRNSAGEAQCWGISSQTNPGVIGVEATQVVNKADFVISYETTSGSCASGIIDNLMFNSVTLESGNGGAINIAEYVQTVLVKNVKLDENLLDKFRVPNAAYGNTQARTVYFRNVYDFSALNMYPGNYVVTTNVVPEGTYSQGLVI